ncbi:MULTISPECIES: GLPGLI family protein [Chitinophaga]|uniref:GLPGLI family protein n=1 Tax=Chitinophaga TaxID=79328 RepID=UPI000DBAD758|nr:GLPGLI family protein [Chitinophaga ginsengisegetis]MDR6566152.1 GLPGLI family protein [Chitinophaga ginsengisegetis]MDR6645882.1 GLPGLI family protein [Chitinophaga ginsengisegetis]MDR6651526.1 GLPGLI family protein [Chitinophaga ginsengisegetis]
MNRTIRLFIAAATLLSATSPVFAQQSGVIEYEVTAKTDPERMRGFQRGGDDAPEIPDVITFKQVFTFSNNLGKLTTERPEGGGFGGRRQRPEGDTSTRNPRRQGPGGMGMGMMGRGGNAQYVDLANKKYEQVFSTFGDDKKTYYTEEDFIFTANNKSSDKTKKIAGYNCKKATIQLKDDTYTVWYTTDLPFSFSPVNGLLPDSNAVVLSAEGSKRAFTAKSVSLKAVTDTDLSIPAGAEKVTQEQMREIRKQEMEKLRKRQQQ